VVEEDETEGDYRAILNFGHTLAHALESATEYKRFLHGEAVAIGVVFAAHLSYKRGLCNVKIKERISRLVKKTGLPVTIPKELKDEHLLRGIAIDKKASGGTIKFVCIEELGKTRFDYLTVEEIGGYLQSS